MSERQTVQLAFVFEGQPAQRLDKFLVDCLPELSRSRIQSLIKDGFVQVNGATAA